MPPEKLTPIGSAPLAAPVDADQPLRDLVGQRADVAPADLVEVWRQRPACGREEPRVGRIRIGTSDERELDDVVRGHHSRVARVKLALETGFFQRVLQGVDAVRHEQRRPFCRFARK